MTMPDGFCAFETLAGFAIVSFVLALLWALT